ncbi:MAG: hypothetical protein ABH879_00180 [archaeon]
MRETLDLIFSKTQVETVGGGIVTIPHALWAAPMEQNAVTMTPFVAPDSVGSMDPDEIRELSDRLLADSAWLKANYDYAKDGPEHAVGNGIPSPLTFHKVYSQAKGG